MIIACIHSPLAKRVEHDIGGQRRSEYHGAPKEIVVLRSFRTTQFNISILFTKSRPYCEPKDTHAKQRIIDATIVSYKFTNTLKYAL